MNTATTAWRNPPQSILVGVDFGEASAGALHAAGALATAVGARLRALHAERFEPPPYFTVNQIDQLEAERRAGQSAAAAHLAEFAAVNAGHTAAVAVADEPPVEALLREAHTADLIVLGTHGRRGPGRWWLGSVAERVVRAATVPVLVTRAATGNAGGLFERVVLVEQHADAGSPAALLADLLARIGGNAVIRVGTAAGRDRDTVEQASIVVMPTPPHGASWILSDAIGGILAGCTRPVLFVPTTT